MSCIALSTHGMSDLDGDSIDGLFIEKYFADHTSSKVFLVCALITLSFTVYSFISVTNNTNFPSLQMINLNLNDQSALTNLKS